MSDQSSLNAGVGATGATGSAAPVAQPDILDRLTAIEARLSALEEKPAPAAASGISDNQKSALSRVLKAIFGEDLAD